MTPMHQGLTARARRPGLPAAGVAVLVACTTAVVAQTPQPPPTFQAGMEVIRLNLSVTDGRSRLIHGLCGCDFAVFEDGIPEDLSFFAREPLRLSVTLLVNCSGSMDDKLGVAQEAGARFIKTLGPDDLGQVVRFSDRITVLQEFTADHSALEAAIRRTRASGSTVLYKALYVTLKQLRSQGGPEAPRRRAILLLSDGEDTASLIDDDQVLAVARQADVGVYEIGLRPDRAHDRQRPAVRQATYLLTT